MKYLPRLRQFGLACSLVAFFSYHSARSQSNPTPHVLSSGPFRFESWSENAPAGTYPANVVFHFTNDPTSSSGYNVFNPGTEDYGCGYNLNTRNRISGLGDRGISFIGSQTAQSVSCDDVAETNSETRFVGTAVIALNTVGFTNTISVNWKAATEQEAPDRTFGLQPQYRIGTDGPFTAIDGASTYESVATPEAPDSPRVLQFNLPPVCNDKELVQVRWVYYQVRAQAGASAARPTMRLDDILISDETTVTLPVELAYFRSQVNADQTVSLTWKTILEKNSRDFRLERSTDAKNYSEIARLDAAGTRNTPKLYAFTDRLPRQGANYYRLRQVDRDGKEYLFRPVAVLIGTEGKGHAYPNPFDGTQFTVRSLAGFGEGIQLLDMARRTLRIQTTRLSELEVQVRPLERLAAGLYLLGLPTDDGRLSWQRLVVR